MAGLIQALNAIVDSHSDIYAVEIEDVEVIFRLPSVKQAYQYQKLLSLATDQQTVSIIYEHIFKAFVVDEFLAHKDGELPAGVPETIAKLILMFSGVDSHSIDYTEELVKLYREQADNTLIYMKRVICQIFPGYTFKSLDSETYQEVVSLFIQAEKILLERGIIEEVHKFGHPEEEKAKPFRVEDVIKQDAGAYSDFDNPQQEDPNTMARMRKIREEAIRRAKEQELRYKRGQR
jgi:hypothetical protein